MRPTKSADGKLSDADLRRIHHAVESSEVDLHQPLLGRDSLTWRINREAALLLGGGRALLMQVAHPLVAEGVARFSNFRGDPLGRLWRTLELTLTITFSSAADAIRAVRTIERAHARVHGQLEETVGPFPAGTKYRAIDPELMLWVHATLVDSALVVYDKFVAPLSARERARYYRESKVTARLMGIDEDLIPPSLSDFERYMRGMLNSDVLSVGSAGRAVAAGVLYPERPLGLRQALLPARIITCELLPPSLRDRFQLPSLPLAQTAVQAIGDISRTLLPWVPAQLRGMPVTALSQLNWR